MITRVDLEGVSFTLGELKNLLDAVELIADELAALPLGDKFANSRRNAACGVISATLAKSEELNSAFNGLFELLREKDAA